MQNVIADQEQVWCVDSRAAAYPGFVSQLADVNDHYESEVGIRHRQVSWGDPACEVQHVMLPAFPCGSGASACIYYANKPVTIHYAEERGYTSWASAHGHELGHGLLGLHEQYADSGGNIGCTGRSDTVMDCGYPHVRYPQPRDVNLGCAIIKTAWCGNPEPVCTPTPQAPCWDGKVADFGNGWTWASDPAPCGTWAFNGRPVLDGGDPAWGGRHIPGFGYVHGGTWAWLDGWGSYYVPVC